MRPLSEFFRVLSVNELEMLHESALEIFENPGMKIENRSALEALEAQGAVVDFQSETARFPKMLVEETIESAREEELRRFSNGTTTLDAPVMIALSIYKRTQKSWCASLAGEPLFNAGILGAGKVFFPEQMMIDIDIAWAQHAFCCGIGGENLMGSVDLIRQKGIGGLFIDTEHTAKHFREYLWIPAIFERLKEIDFSNALTHDPVGTAYERR